VVNIEDVHDAAVLLDPVDDAIGTAPGAVTTVKRSEQRLAGPQRVDRKCGFAELPHRGGSGFRQPLSDRSPCGGEPDLVSMRGFGAHVPVTRRRARSWRTVAISAPGSPRPRAARLSEMRDSVAVTEDFQGHLQALQVIHRQQDSLGLPVAGKRDPLVLLVRGCLNAPPGLALSTRCAPLGTSLPAGGTNTAAEGRNAL
jgi:hypothetical protein